MAESKTSGTEKNTGMAVVAYLLFFVPLLIDEVKDDPFVKFHVKQGLLIFLTLIAGLMVGVIPLIGWLIAMIAPFFVFVMLVIGILNALAGKKEPLPLIGKYAEEWFKF